MNDCGDTVFLDVEPAVLFRRLRVAKQQRPLLANKSDEELMDFICEALQKDIRFIPRQNICLKLMSWRIKNKFKPLLTA